MNDGNAPIMARPKILALCGSRSNNAVTQLQLENLHVTSERYDIHYLHGNIIVEDDDDVDAALAGMVRGPFYSWINNTSGVEAMNESIVNSVRLVIGATRVYGPFDGVYGFSHGGLIASLAANITLDSTLKNAVGASPCSTSEHSRRKLISDTFCLRHADVVDATRRHSVPARRPSVATSVATRSDSVTSFRRPSLEVTDVVDATRRHSVPTSRPSVATRSDSVTSFSRPWHSVPTSRPSVATRSDSVTSFRRPSLFRMPSTCDWTCLEVVPFNFVITACAGISASGNLHSIVCSDLISQGGAWHLHDCVGKVDINEEEVVGTASLTDEEEGPKSSINVVSLHLIGIDDPLKAQSELIASYFRGTKVMYHQQGHVVGRESYKDRTLIQAIYDISHSLYDADALPILEDLKEVNPITSLALHPHFQLAHVKLKDEILPHGATIINCLKAQPRDKPFLFDARNDKGVSTTYGEVLDFIDGGGGDLRRIGVNSGDVVAYGAPPGGGAASAMVFLCVGAQTTAAPLAPGTSELEALDALDQFHAKHLVLFEDVEAPGISAAFTKYATSGSAQLHHARINRHPGQFEFTSVTNASFSSLPKLSNPETGCCLLLRTSGTTAKPKGVPLDQRALLKNSAIIAASLELKDSDVCYSVMPLFHIGGISASILCTLVSGGSVCCDGEPFDPGHMLDALAVSRPQPTWYSAVPTIHNATAAYMRERAADDPRFSEYGIDKYGVWRKGHSLRLIRSGAASLLTPDAEALSKAFGGLPIYPTYSMSEQMPISQPPAGKGNTVTDKPGSVGVPVATSLAIVNRTNLRPQPWGVEGEVAISGDTVMRHYLENSQADAQSYFFLTFACDTNTSLSNCRFFLTGDVGVLDNEGYLYLKGRAKELIKKGGEQVSPFEVEEQLLDHPWVRLAVCFSVPSKVYGEEVGCAIVLTADAPENIHNNEVIKSLRKWMKDKLFSPNKWPTKWWIGPEEELPKTNTKKFIRVGLANKLGFGEEVLSGGSNKATNAKIDWGVIAGFRFILSCYVMFMHIGSDESWGHFNNLRGFPWHVHAFFILSGYSMASPMNPVITKKRFYFLTRMGNMYPMYAIALILGLVNLVVVCRPSTFDPIFHWDSQPDDNTRGFFCEGTPITRSSYWGSLILTIITHAFGVAAVTPVWAITWWMGYYLWFSNMYYQCLAIFPAMYNYLFIKTRKNLPLLLKCMVGMQTLNIVLLTTAWLLLRHGPSYRHVDGYTGEKNEQSEYDNAYGSDPVVSNIYILSFYLFSPCWMLYFVIGGILAFIYDAYRPAEHHNAFVWGHIADACTIVQILLSIVYICQPVYDDTDAIRWFRPDEANFIGDSPAVSRLWDEICSRMMAPLTTLWIFAMSTGEGWTASFLRRDILVNTLSPTAYNCFLFHQMIGQWYLAVTRPGLFWNWWQFRKSFYWFSPEPCPVEWYEYFFVVLIVVAFSSIMDKAFAPAVKGFAKRSVKQLSDYFLNIKEEDEEIDITQLMLSIIENMTGIMPEEDSTLDEVGLASVGIPVLVARINSSLSTKNLSTRSISITSVDLIRCKTVKDIVDLVEDVRDRMEHDGV